jgi:hypothetical protein
MHPFVERNVYGTVFWQSFYPARELTTEGHYRFEHICTLPMSFALISNVRGRSQADESLPIKLKQQFLDAIGTSFRLTDAAKTTLLKHAN